MGFQFRNDDYYYDDKQHNQSTRFLVTIFLTGLTVLMAGASISKYAATICGITFLILIGLVFIFHKIRGFNEWAHTQNMIREIKIYDEKQRIEAIVAQQNSAKNFWGSLTAQNIVDFVNLQNKTNFVEDNLVYGSIDEENCQSFNVTLYCGGQTIKTPNGFIRNRNVNYKLHRSELDQSMKEFLDNVNFGRVTWINSK
jgi:cell division protein FtsB